MDRVVLFMDYQNVHGWARRKFLGTNAHPASGHVYPLRVGELLVSRRARSGELAQVRVYRGRPNPARQSGAARANDRQASDWSRSGKVAVIRRNLQYPPGYPDVPATEKGIDVAIAVDMIRMGMAHEMDAAILFSSDKDLLPAVEMLWEMEGCHVEVAAWSEAPRLRFEGGQRPWCHYLSRSDFYSVRDPVDYSRFE